MKKSKQYNVLEEVREFRDKYSIIYWNNPELFKERLKYADARFDEELAARGIK
jgi:hypothetical protein